MRVRFAVASVSVASVSVVAVSVVAVSGLAPLGARSFAQTEPKPSTCSPNGVSLSITATDNKFDKDCLAAPANKAFKIALDNQDYGIPHNVSIYDDAHGTKTLFKGEVTQGPMKITYSVPALPAGKYVFRCDPHPDYMLGNFIVS